MMLRKVHWPQALVQRRGVHISNRSYPNASRFRSSRIAVPVVAATLTTGILLSGQFRGYVEPSRQWLGICTVRCDSGPSSSNWTASIPFIGSKRENHTDAKDTGGHQDPPPQTPNQSKDEDSNSSSDSETSSFYSINVSSLGDKITDLLIPDWARMLPAFISKLQNELSLAPGTLAEEIWYEANDPETNPEITWDATVRISDELCQEEKSFLEKRKHHTKRALAKYLGLNEDELHPDDIPTIAMCGSGGGLRALVAGTSSYLSAHESGLFDCVTYTAGVSGSCWLQALYYSSLSHQSHQRIIKHLKNRLGVHIAFPPPALTMLNSAPTNKYLLSGIVEKLKGVPDADYGIVDLYGLLLAARLLVPKGELSIDDTDLKISNQRRFTDSGKHPLPIYTAVRHEIPLEEQIQKSPEEAVAKAKSEAWFQWFEFTPYEFWCEEFQAGIPTWAMGRTFDNGKTVVRDNGLSLPELRLPLMLGIWGSAFCATLSHYYREIRPIMKSLSGFGGLDQMIAERDEDLVKVHPIDPATIPNFALGLEEWLPSSCPKSVFKSTHLQLMDAGMSNNLPLYPLLRPGRDVDILIAFDASADVRTDNWLKVADGYARQRGIKGWPIGAGWPGSDEPKEQIVEELEAAQAQTEEQATSKLQEAQYKQATEEQLKPTIKRKDLSYCNVWIGTTEERSSDDEPPPSKLVEEDWELMKPDAGIAVIYFPFLANPKVDGVDPHTSDFMSTWNFVYTPDQIDSCVALARANFEEGQDQTKKTIRAVYERKKEARLEREKQAKAQRRQRKMRMGILGKKLGETDHGDQFS